MALTNEQILGLVEARPVGLIVSVGARKGKALIILKYSHLAVADSRRLSNLLCSPLRTPTPPVAISPRRMRMCEFSTERLARMMMTGALSIIANLRLLVRRLLQIRRMALASRCEQVPDTIFMNRNQRAACKQVIWWTMMVLLSRAKS